ncbi:MAG: ABC transporter permease [Acidobacteriota bacterium]
MPRLVGVLRRSPTATVGVALVLLLTVVAALAPWLTTAAPEYQFDTVAGKLLAPGSERFVFDFAGDRLSILAERAQRTGDRAEIIRRGRTESFPLAEVANLLPDGSFERRTFPLGTDRLGRDLWSRIVFGARVSLSIGLLSALVALAIGLLVGSLAAIGGPLVDGLLMRLVDTFLALPRLFLLIALVAVLSPGRWAIVAILGGTTWMPISRLVRAEILGLKERNFIHAARGLGQHPLAILRRHLLPNALTPALVQTGLMIGGMILAESSLSFLGLGVPEPFPSWGQMIADITGGPVRRWWMAAFPGFAIVLTVIAFNLLTDGLRDALDPRHR